MGRVKLEIKKLDHSASRIATYSKRKNGLLKKAQELSVLCDIDLVLVMFSPTGKPVICQGKNSSVEGIIKRFALLSPQERAKRKLESLLVLKRHFTKSGHDVNIQDFIGFSNQTSGGIVSYVNLLRAQLSEVQKRLNEWSNPHKINNVEFLEQMEDYISNLLYQIQMQKESLRNQNSSGLECTKEVQNSMHQSINLGIEQHLQHVTQISNKNYMAASSEDSNSLPKSEIWPSAGDSSANRDYLRTAKKPDLASTGEDSGVMKELPKTECMRNELICFSNDVMKEEFLRSKLIGANSAYLRNELIKTESLRNELLKTQSLNNELMKADSFKNGFFQTTSLILHPYEEFNFTQSYERRPQPMPQTKEQQPSTDNYYVDENLEPNPGYNSAICNWASMSGPLVASTFEEHFCPQERYLCANPAGKECGSKACRSHSCN